MKLIFRNLLVLVFVISSGPLFALSLQEAKQRGLVGEQPNGYLGVVGRGSPEVTALVNNINAKRKQAYKGIANKNSTPLDAIEKLAGQKAIKKTPSGQYVRNPRGDWIKN